MPMNADLDDYICGGNFLTKRVSRPAYVSNLAPDRMTTLSACFTDIAPDSWADADYRHDDVEQVQEAVKFGIPATAVPELAGRSGRNISQIFSRVCPSDKTFIAIAPTKIW